MKIGIVCPYNPFIPGGVQNQVAGQAAELQARGHTVRIVTPRPRGYTDAPPRGTIFVGQSARIKAQQTWVDVSVSVDVELIDQILERERFDLLHFHEPLIPVLGLQLLSRAHCPTVGTFHANLPDTFLAKTVAGSIGPYKRSVFKHLDVVTAVSRAATSYLEDDLDLDHVNFIPNGVDLSQLTPSNEAERDPNLVLYVGRLEKRKGVRYLLKAFALAAERMPELRLVIVGDGPERKMLESKVSQWRVPRVEFKGAVSDSEKLRLLASCGTFTSPALYGESFGVVLLEAMAAGAVVVAGNNPGYEAVLTGTGRISLVDSRRAEEYARRLELLSSDAPLRRVWQRWAAQNVKNYAYPAIIDRYESIYRQLASTRR